MAQLPIPSVTDDTVSADVEAPEQDPKTLEEHLSFLVGAFEESESSTTSARERSERCRDYYSNIQFTAAELAIYKERKQAPVYENIIQRKVDTLCGIERQMRTDPKAFPRNPNDEQTAGAATDALRFIADRARFNSLLSEVFNDYLVEGTCGIEVLAAEKSQGDVDIGAKRVPWDRIWYDPHSRQLDFSDAAYKGIVIWTDATQAKRDYPDATQYIETTLTTFGVGATYDDRPNNVWCDSRRKRVRIVQAHYLRDGDWWVATFTKGGFLIAPVVSPYKDKDGNSASNLHLRSAYIDRENNRYGPVEGWISLQDALNKYRSKSLHLLSERQTFGNAVALLDTNKAKKELAKPNGHIELNAGAKFGEDFGVIPTNDMAQGIFLMYQDTRASIDASGPNAALQGKDDRLQSGRALQARAQMGAIENEPHADGLRELKHVCFEAFWMCVRQFWTAETWVRVTDDDRNVKFVGLNKPVTLKDKLGQMQPQEAQMAAQQMQLQPGDPRLQQVIEVENDVSGLDVDIVIEEGPDISTLQSEQFEQLVQLAAMPNSQGAIPFTAIIKASSLRNKDAILDEMEGANKQNAEKQQAMQQEQFEAARQQAFGEIEKLRAEIAKLQAQTQQILVDTELAPLEAVHKAQQDRNQGQLAHHAAMQPKTPATVQ